MKRLLTVLVSAALFCCVSAASAGAAGIDTTITAGPTGLISTNSATFSFKSNVAVASFDCALDAGAWSGCSSPKTYSSLADGPHTFKVRAKWLLLVDSTPATRSFTVDRTAPTLSITSPVEDGDGDYDVTLPASGVVSLGGGAENMCAVMSNGDAKCWGWNGRGQLGDGTTTDRSTPVDVVGVHNVAEIHSGQLHTCARKTDGTVWCWGWNGRGELGDGTNTDRLTPAPVPGISGATQLAVGDDGACILDAAGTVRCWGAPFGGTSAVVVSGWHAPVKQLAMNFSNVCVVTTADALECVGSGYTGEFGSLPDSLSAPTVVPGLSSGVAQVSKYAEGTCVRMIAGGVKCMGFASFGQIGDGSTADPRTSPTNALGLGAEVTSIASAFTANCALVNSGDVKCWGSSGYGIFADITSVPTTLAGLSGISSITAYGNGLCALRPSGPVTCLGDNRYGAKGNGVFDPTFGPGNYTASDVIGLSTGAGGTVSLSVTFTASDANGVSTTCSVDGAAFTSCSSPLAVSGLGAGAHTVAVRATDGAGNVTTRTLHVSVNP